VVKIEVLLQEVAIEDLELVIRDQGLALRVNPMKVQVRATDLVGEQGLGVLELRREEASIVRTRTPASIDSGNEGFHSD
jgi:hypothetical protein